MNQNKTPGDGTCIYQKPDAELIRIDTEDLFYASGEIEETPGENPGEWDYD